MTNSGKNRTRHFLPETNQAGREQADKVDPANMRYPVHRDKTLSRIRGLMILLAFCTTLLLITLGYYAGNRKTSSENRTPASTATPRVKKECGLRNIGPPFLLIYVYSSPGNFINRQLIRSTYASLDVKKKCKLVVVFFTGISAKSMDDAQLRTEVETFDDMVVFNYTDTYRNLPRKSALALHWLQDNCGNARYFLKTDDDVLLNVFAVVKYLNNQMAKADKTLHCLVYPKSGPIRKPDSRYYVTKEEYPGRVYPPYCDGNGVLFTRLVLGLLSNGTGTNGSFWIEDVYTFGMVRSKNGIGLTSIGIHFLKNYTSSRFKMKRHWFVHFGDIFQLQHWKGVWKKILELDQT